MSVVDYLVAHIDGRAEPIERPFYDLDCPNHAGTEAARLRQDDLHEPEPLDPRLPLSNRALARQRGTRSRCFPVAVSARITIIIADYLDFDRLVSN